MLEKMFVWRAMCSVGLLISTLSVNGLADCSADFDVNGGIANECEVGVRISSSSECARAAQCLGLAYRGEHVADAQPIGCFVYSGSSTEHHGAYFNTHPTGGEMEANNLVCGKVACPNGQSDCPSQYACDTDAGECKTTCEGYACPSGWVAKDGQSSILGQGRTDSACCLIAPGTCGTLLGKGTLGGNVELTSVVCGSGYVYDTSKSTTACIADPCTAADKTTCCKEVSCPQRITIQGASTVQPDMMGVYTITHLIGPWSASEPVYRNANGSYLFFWWDPEGRWQGGGKHSTWNICPSYTSTCCGLRTHASSDRCPLLASESWSTCGPEGWIDSSTMPIGVTPDSTPAPPEPEASSYPKQAVPSVLAAAAVAAAIFGK